VASGEGLGLPTLRGANLNALAPPAAETAAAVAAAAGLSLETLVPRLLR
jgi:hypothetical protein